MSEISEQSYGMYRQIWDLSVSPGENGAAQNAIYSLWLEYNGEQPAYKVFSGSGSRVIISSVSSRAWPIAHTHPMGKGDPSRADREMVYIQALRAHGTSQVERPSYVISGPERSEMQPYYPAFDFGAVSPPPAEGAIARIAEIAASNFQESGIDINRYVLVQITGNYYTFVLLNEDNSFGYDVVEDDAIAMELKKLLWNRGNRIIAFDGTQRRWVQRR